MNPSWIHLGRLFPTPLYHPALAGTPPEEGNWNQLGGLFPTPLYHLHPCRREHARRKCDFHGSAALAERPCFKINDLRHRQVIRFGAALPCAARQL